MAWFCLISKRLILIGAGAISTTSLESLVYPSLSELVNGVKLVLYLKNFRSLLFHFCFLDQYKL